MTHLRLVIPGPVEVRPEILEAQTEWMIGHRSTAFAELFARLQPKLQQAFLTDSRVYVSGSSGTGLWEGASRNCIRDDCKALHLVWAWYLSQPKTIKRPFHALTNTWSCHQNTTIKRSTNF
jgi:aspartate aminotransferase-like enzyme